MKLSIITINLNNESGLLKTLESVNRQTCQDFEYIVIDGESFDGSSTLIAANKGVNKWISERDKGVYDAMNKGIKLATGEYVLFLNSGDYLYEENTLENIYNTLHTQDIIYGDLIFDTNGHLVTHYYPHKLTFNYLFYGSLGHPACFIRRELFDKFGLYKLQYKIIADWVFFIETIAKHQVTTRHIDTIISIFNTDGMSSDPKNQAKIAEDRQKFLQAEFPFYYYDYAKHVEVQNTLNRIKSCKAYKWLRALGVKKFQY